jgi:hypothetical protein
MPRRQQDGSATICDGCKQRFASLPLFKEHLGLPPHALVNVSDSAALIQRCPAKQPPFGRRRPSAAPAATVAPAAAAAVAEPSSIAIAAGPAARARAEMAVEQEARKAAVAATRSVAVDDTTALPTVFLQPQSHHAREELATELEALWRARAVADTRTAALDSRGRKPKYILDDDLKDKKFTMSRKLGIPVDPVQGGGARGNTAPASARAGSSSARGVRPASAASSSGARHADPMGSGTVGERCATSRSAGVKVPTYLQPTRQPRVSSVTGRPGTVRALGTNVADHGPVFAARPMCLVGGQVMPLYIPGTKRVPDP